MAGKQDKAAAKEAAKVRRAASREKRKQIFEAFMSTKGQRGTGLGLAVTRKIVQQHGGRIELEPPAGRGATFTITLPSDQAPMDSGDTRLPRPVSSSQIEDEF